MKLLSITASEADLPKACTVAGIVTVTRRPASKDGDHKNIIATTLVDPCAASTLLPASTRSNGAQAIYKYFRLARTSSFGIIVAKRGVPREDEDAIVARPRRTTADKLCVVADAAREPAVPSPSKADPRLVNAVRLLARQAARDFVQAETGNRTRDRLPE